MHLPGLIPTLRESEVYQNLLSRLQDGAADLTMNTIRSARPYFLAALAQDWPGPVLFLTAQVKRAHNVVEQLPVWLTEETPIYRFAEPTPMFYDRLPWEHEVIHSRIETLAGLLRDTGPQPLVVASARAMMQRTLPVHHFRGSSALIQKGQRHNFDKLVHGWVEIGYEPAAQVIQPGTFSRRGGILDIFPMAASLPVRIEFFGDEIDTLRTFDPTTQRSLSAIESAQILPAREALPKATPLIANHLATWFDSLQNAAADLTGPISDRAPLESGMSFPLLEQYLPYLFPNPVSLLDYAPDHALIVIEDRDELREAIQEIDETARKNRAENQQSGQIAPDHPAPYLDWEALSGVLQGRALLHLHHSDGTEAQKRLFAPGGRFGGQLRSVLTHLRGLRSQGEQTVVVTQQAERLTKLWTEQDTSIFIPTMENIAEAPPSGALIFVNGALQAGWTLRAGQSTLNLLTDAELFGWSRPEPRRRKSSHKTGRTNESHYADWKAGDFVVHIDYGIGKFSGLQHRMVEGTEREYLAVEYGGTDMLYVPIHQADRLTPYVGPSEAAPVMNRLGKQVDWLKTREKAQRNAEEEARELLNIYAQRAAAHGHAFSTDTPWQNELEAGFPFVETEDQLRALVEVKADMERQTPMDRLICGEVGYGKTEVALRAAFKAVMDGKQVAILAPTTVLAQQHYETFSNRLQPFPIKVEVMSRFRTKEQQNRILPAIASGEVDILVGTHRILSEDIRFKDLGMIIIDEEQRFGVKHKEHFKKLRAQLDVLTLTATPIPRTLYMSLSGVRDISMIQTPPEDRLPVITHVGVFDEKLARQAILREIERGGQAFVVHNRVRTIEHAKERFERIVPEARIIIGHGQMAPRQLESVMAQFGRGEYDVLLSTSIIENGIDMPTVNTLIVDRADWFGMSQLYQLRGRVGRSAQQAYAYFFHEEQRLTDDARVRLETMAEHSELGAGFQIAMRDLELRGAGDILSMRQTGHVAAVGLHLYTQLLSHEVQRLKGRKSGETIPAAVRDRVVIDLPIPAYLPTDWIPEMALRLQIYRHIGALQSQEEIETMREELRDRFGALPQAVEGLLYQMQIKLLAQSINAGSISKPREHILIKLPYLVAVDRPALAAALGRDTEVSRTAVELRVTEEGWQPRLIEVLNYLKKGMPEGMGV